MFLAIQTPITTDRLVLRPFVPADAEARFRIQSDPSLVHYTGANLTRAKSDASFAGDLRRHAAGEICCLAICDDRLGADPVGYCRLQEWNDEIELVIGLIEAARGEKRGLEAARALVESAFRDTRIPTIVGRVAPDNEGSRRLCEQIGMVVAGQTANTWAHTPDLLFRVTRPTAVPN